MTIQLAWHLVDHVTEFLLLILQIKRGDPKVLLVGHYHHYWSKTEGTIGYYRLGVMSSFVSKSLVLLVQPYVSLQNTHYKAINAHYYHSKATGWFEIEIIMSSNHKFTLDWTFIYINIYVHTYTCNYLYTYIYVALAGDLTRSKDTNSYNDGVRANAHIMNPEHAHQTEDGLYILFIDSKSCARRMSTSNLAVQTVIGI